MIRTTKPQGSSNNKLGTLAQVVISDILSRNNLARRLGHSYGDKRKLYEALGYPQESELTFEYFWNKYDRNDIARTVIDRPIEKTWTGEIAIVEKDKSAKDSPFNKQWTLLNKEFKLKKRLTNLDKLTNIGKYGLLLFGFDDVHDDKDWKKPAKGKKKLLYLRTLAESEGVVHSLETNTSNERYGQPLLYKVTVGVVSQLSTSGISSGPGNTKQILVHYSRILHVTSNNLTNDTRGESYMKPIINRLIDIEKILGGDAETFWRGARPGYAATEKEDYELDDTAKDQLYEELDKYEHDLRRVIALRGIDLKALEQQVEDPSNHLDVQFQAISAKTGIPKRILTGSERGELASSQDTDAWLGLIKTRQEDFAEPEILRPFVDKCIEFGILPSLKEYEVIWADPFSPSQEKKVALGKERALALKHYVDGGATAMELLHPEVAFKTLLGFDEKQTQEALSLMDASALEEESEMRKMAMELDIEGQKKMLEEEDGEGEGEQTPPPVKKPVQQKSKTTKKK